ncbi:MAG: hypothetical protein HY072_06435 [Deltaproteobacteria bacterium]|nr:hypothetical protein [Deltaproteobacteria bacterium]
MIIWIAIIFLISFSIGAEPVSDEVSSFEREVQLACGAQEKDISQSRKMIAQATVEKLQNQLSNIQTKIQAIHLQIKDLTEGSFLTSQEVLKESKAQYEKEIKKYRLMLSDSNLGKDSAGIEVQLERVRTAQRKLDILVQRLKSQDLTTVDKNKPKAHELQQAKEELNKSYKEIEVLLKTADIYQGFVKKVQTCLREEIQEPKATTAVEVPRSVVLPKGSSEVDVPGTVYKRRTSVE